MSWLWVVLWAMTIFATIPVGRAFHGHIVHLPPQQLCIELFDGLHIVGHEFTPAKFSMGLKGIFHI
jgi:hypothetical protein